MMEVGLKILNDKKVDGIGFGRCTSGAFLYIKLNSYTTDLSTSLTKLMQAVGELLVYIIMTSLDLRKRSGVCPMSALKGWISDVCVILIPACLNFFLDHD